jgi:transposase
LKEVPMLKSKGEQGSFYDAEYLCEQLIPPDSFYRKFKELVTPLVQGADLDAMYCGDNGRPPISPSLLAMAVILQFYRGFSDREMETACMYDIQIKYALGLKLDERPFDHSSLGDFRKRLLENSREKEIFDKILEHLIEQGLVKKDEIQRIDATHVLADLAIPTMVTLVKKGIYEVLKPLADHKEAYEALGKVVDFSQYTKKKVNDEGPGRLDLEKRKRKLVEVVSDARKVLEHTKPLKTNKDLKEPIELLKRILRENIEEDGDGDPKERGYKEKPKDILVSPIDPDARFGAKSATKRFMGYKANVTESVGNNIITNVKVMPGNAHDGTTMVEAIVEQKGNGLVPAKVIGDSAYGRMSNREELKGNGTMVVAPIYNKNDRAKGIYPKSMFKYDAEKKLLTCPQGVTTKAAYWDERHQLHSFHFPMAKCNACAVQKECTRDADGRRTVGISIRHEEMMQAETYNRSEQFKKDMKFRPAVERKLAELVRYHGLRRARYRGLKKLGLQGYFTAAAVNIKRWFKLLVSRAGPPIPALVGA